jgi:hypothetical protein
MSRKNFILIFLNIRLLNPSPDTVSSRGFCVDSIRPFSHLSGKKHIYIFYVVEKKKNRREDFLVVLIYLLGEK